ncbi:hypothetical protein AMS60_16680 [Bacillus sp. FJAT-21945]|nr:hypothetical protein AMS60_16680 [Bacillus sp. FJAT-21945]
MVKFIHFIIARVSRGRTIREVIIGVLLLPALVSFFWFAVFGTSSIEVQHAGNVDLTKYATEEVLFAVFSEFPWSMSLSILAIFLIGIFFITSADSAFFLIDKKSILLVKLNSLIVN